MCLRVKYKRQFKGNRGWKLVYPKQDETYATGMCGGKEVILCKDKFTRAKGRTIKDGGVTYPSGFYIFTKLTDARKIKYAETVICEVEFQEQVAYGQVFWWGWLFGSETDHTPTVVARECKIIREVE